MWPRPGEGLLLQTQHYLLPDPLERGHAGRRPFFSSRWEVFCAVLLQKLAQHSRRSYPHNRKTIHIKAQLGMGLERTACQFPRGITQSHLPWVQLSSHTVGIKSNLSTKVVVRNCTKTHYDLGPVTAKQCYSYLTNIYPKMTGWPAAPSKN